MVSMESSSEFTETQAVKFEEDNESLTVNSSKENVQTDVVALKENFETRKLSTGIKVPFSNLDEVSGEVVSLKDTLKGMFEFENGIWKCKVCGKISKNRSAAKEHAEIHIEGLTYPCDECDKSYHTSPSLRQHKKQHYKYQCVLCRKNFISLSTLEMHLSSSHRERETDMISVEASSPFKENTQAVKFEEDNQIKTVNCFKENVETVTFEENIETKKLENGKCIKVPLSQHDGEFKPDEDDLLSLNNALMGIFEFENGIWKCKVCGKISKNQSQAKEHGEIHIEGLSYPCEECGKSYASSASMRNHKRQHK